MRWDLGIQGVGLLALMAIVAGIVTHLVWGRTSPRWLWLAASIAYVAIGMFVSEVWFGWATQEELQPNIDGLSFDEVLLIAFVLPLVVVAVARVISHRRRSGPRAHA